MRTSLGLVVLSVALGLAAGAYLARRPATIPEPEARSTTEGIIPSNPTGGPLWDSGLAQWNDGRYAAACSSFARGETEHPRDAAWPQALASCLAARGLHREALEALGRCRAIAPLSHEAKEALRRSRLEVGFADAGQANPWSARQLADAILLDFPGDSMALLLQGYAWAMEGALPMAEQALQSLVAAHPGQIEAYPLLVQCAFRRGDASDADRWIDSLHRRAPDFPGLALWREQAGQLRSGRGAFSSRLRVTCDGSCPLGTEREVLDAAERSWTSLAHDLGRAPTTPVSIRIAPDGVMPAAWAEAVFDGQIRLPFSAAGGSERRDPILRHELSHAFLVDFSGGRIPLWMNEGLAQWLEGRRPSALPDARSADWLDRIAARRSFMDLDADEAGLAYAWSLAVASELMELHGSTTLLRYLDLLAGGTPEPEAFQSAFGRTYASLSARIREGM